MQRVINVDSQILSSVQSCPRKAKYKFIDHIQPIFKSAALEKGELIHLPLEIYYSLLGGPETLNIYSETFKEIRKEGFILLDELIELSKPGTPDRRIKIIDLAIKFARFRSNKMNINVDECEDVIYQFSEYCEYYIDEPIHALACEEVGSKVLFENEDIKIIYSVKIDLIAEIGNRLFPVDHKSSSRRQDPSSMSNQFFGYCWFLGKNEIWINTIGFQKTLSRKERFQRHELEIDTERIKEWKKWAIYTILNWVQLMDSNLFPMNYTACKGQFPCDMISICEKSNSLRESIVDRNFKIEDAWDPAKALINIQNPESIKDSK